MKTTFLSQKCMEENGINGFIYEFFRYDYGPFSKDVYDTKDALNKNGLITADYALTESGKAVLDEFAGLIEANEHVFGCIDSALKEIKGKDVRAIMDYVYSLEMVPYGSSEKQTIGEMKEHTTILRSDNYSSLKIDSSEIVTLEIYMDKGLLEALQRGMDDAKNGRLHRMEDVFN